MSAGVPPALMTAGLRPASIGLKFFCGDAGEPVFVFSAQRELFSVRHYYAIRTVKHLLDFTDPFNVDNRRSMNAPKLFWIELIFNRLHGFSQKISTFVHMDANVIA